MIGERWFSSWCFCRHYKYWTYCQQHKRRTSTDPIFQCALWWFVWVCAGRRERASPSHPSKSWIMPPYFGLFGRRSSEMLICEARYYSYRRALVVANVYVRQSSSNLRLMCLENPLFWTKNWWETKIVVKWHARRIIVIMFFSLFTLFSLLHPTFWQIDNIKTSGPW